MTLARLLSTMTRLTGEDVLTDTEQFQYVLDAADWLIGRGHTDISDLTLDDGGLSITPEPTVIQGLLLAYKAAELRLTDLYNQKVDSGDVGRSWRSGLEAESTISLAESYKTTIGSVSRELEELILIKNAPDAGARFQ